MLCCSEGCLSFTTRLAALDMVLGILAVPFLTNCFSVLLKTNVALTTVALTLLCEALKVQFYWMWILLPKCWQKSRYWGFGKIKLSSLARDVDCKMWTFFLDILSIFDPPFDGNPNIQHHYWQTLSQNSPCQLCSSHSFSAVGWENIEMWSAKWLLVMREGKD